MRNIHAVDELADVRTKLKELETREAELKAQISADMGSSDTLFGNEYLAFQKLSSRKGAIDTAAMAKAGIDVEAYRKADVTVLSIIVERCERQQAA